MFETARAKDEKHELKKVVLPDDYKMLPHHDIPKIESALKLYLAVLRGFLEPPNSQSNKSPEEEVASGGTRASKLRLAASKMLNL